jgi:hypothetical protein
VCIWLYCYHQRWLLFVFSECLEFCFFYDLFQQMLSFWFYVSWCVRYLNSSDCIETSPLAHFSLCPWCIAYVCNSICLSGYIYLSSYHLSICLSMESCRINDLISVMVAFCFEKLILFYKLQNCLFCYSFVYFLWCWDSNPGMEFLVFILIRFWKGEI